ncbi:MAG: hypothetical protein HQL03_14975, partial [Nitrospirae bacterium]|nr:hypothetical protein [Nitrospirota bacterium]
MKRCKANQLMRAIAVVLLLVVASCGEQGGKNAANNNTNTNASTLKALKTQGTGNGSLTKGNFTPKDLADIDKSAYKDGQLLVRF